MSSEMRVLRGRADRFEDLWEGVLDQVGELRLVGGWRSLAVTALLLETLRHSRSGIEAALDAEAYLAFAIQSYAKGLGAELRPSVSAAGAVSLRSGTLSAQFSAMPRFSILQQVYELLEQVVAKPGMLVERIAADLAPGEAAFSELLARLYPCDSSLERARQLLDDCGAGDRESVLRRLCRAPDRRVHEAALTVRLALDGERLNNEWRSVGGILGLPLPRIVSDAETLRHERGLEPLPLQWKLDLGCYPLLAVEHRRLYARPNAKRAAALLRALEQGQFEEALEVSEQWQLDSPHQWDLRLQSAVLAHRLRRGEGPVTELLDAAQIERVPGRVLSFLGRTLAELGEREHAMTLLREALGSVGKDFEFVAEAALAYGKGLVGTGQLLKAILVADIGLREARSPIPLIRLKLNALRELDSYPELVRCQGQMMLLSPLHADSVSYLVEQALGRYSTPKLLPVRSDSDECSRNDSEALQFGTLRETELPHKKGEMRALAHG